MELPYIKRGITTARYNMLPNKISLRPQYQEWVKFGGMFAKSVT